MATIMCCHNNIIGKVLLEIYQARVRIDNGLMKRHMKVINMDI